MGLPAVSMPVGNVPLIRASLERSSIDVHEMPPKGLGDPLMYMCSWKGAMVRLRVEPMPGGSNPSRCVVVFEPLSRSFAWVWRERQAINLIAATLHQLGGAEFP